MKQLSHSSAQSQPRVMAAIPCFNTGQFIEDIVSRARKHVSQVVIIDDGSHDGTAEIASAAGALVVKHGQNLGYGKAISSCFEVARAQEADVLIILDGDGQHNPDEIPRLTTPILQGEADLVIGSRFLGNDADIPRYRKFGIKVITFLFNFGSKTRVSDSQSGFRGYHRKLFACLAPGEKGMSGSIEILEKARIRGAVIKEVPVHCYYPPSVLNLNAINHGLSVAWSVVKLRLRSRLGGNRKESSRA